MVSSKPLDLGIQHFTNAYNNKISGVVDNNLYMKVEKENIIIIVVYVHDIIFRGDTNNLSQRVAEDMLKKFEMYMLSELSFILGMQIYQSEKCIFISKTKYIKEMLKKFKMEVCKLVSTPMVT